MAQRPHDPFSPHDAIDDEPRPAKKTTARRGKPRPTDATAADSKSMVVNPTAVKATAKSTAAKKTPAKRAGRKRANKTSTRKGRR